MLAIVFSLEKWHQYTYGRHVTIHSDHKPWPGIPSPNLWRRTRRIWNHQCSDLPSDVWWENWGNPSTYQQWSSLTAAEADYSTRIAKGQVPTNTSCHTILTHTTPCHWWPHLPSERLVIPKDMRSRIKKDIHAGHKGVDTSLRRAQEHLFWSGMSKEIKDKRVDTIIV